MKPTYLVCATWCSWSPLLALDEDLDARIALVGVMEPLEMVIIHEKVWHPHKWWHDDPWTLYAHWWCIWKWFESWNPYIWWFVHPWLLETLIWWNIWSWCLHHLVMESYVMGVNTKNCSPSSTWYKPHTYIIFLPYFPYFWPSRLWFTLISLPKETKKPTKGLKTPKRAKKPTKGIKNLNRASNPK